MRKALVFNLWFFFLLQLNHPLSAHESNTGYLLIDFRTDSLRLTFKFDITDLERIFGLDTNGDRVVDRDELLAKVPQIYDFIEEHFSLRIDYLRESLDRLEGSFEQDQLGNMFINFNFIKTGIAPPGAFGINIDFFKAFGADFKVLGRLAYGDDLQQMILTNATPLFNADLQKGGADLLKQISAFILLGMEHIFIGVDHIMFLFGLLVVGGRFLNLVKIVTSFTISHSVTLILAALQIIALPGWLIESAIALSIVYIAIENFIVKKTDTRWVVTGVFGLVHGFGFANVLGDLGLPSKGLVPSLFAFNVGVEIGQIIIVAVMLPVIWLILRTKYNQQFIWGGSAIIMIFGATWFLNRAFGLPVNLI